MGGMKETGPNRGVATSDAGCSTRQLQERLESLVSWLTELLSGQILDGRYALERVLHTDAVSALYEALDLEQRVPVHIRVIKALCSPAPVPTPVAALPRARDVLELGMTATGIPFAVLEPVSGETLADRLHRSKPITDRQARAWSQSVVDTIADAHEQGLVHGALDLNAIFIPDGPDGPGAPVLLGLELAALRAADPSAIHPRWESSEPFLAPETRADAPPAPPADSYSLALLLGSLFASTGPPHPATPAERASWIEKWVPYPTRAVAVRALDPRPLRRPTARELAEALRSTSPKTR